MSFIRSNDNLDVIDPFKAVSNSKILRPVVSRPLAGLGKNGNQLPAPGVVGNYTVDDHNKAVFLGAVSDSYTVVQMRDLCAAAEASMKSFFTPEQIAAIQIEDRTGFNGAYVERAFTLPFFSETIKYGNPDWSAKARGLEIGTSVAAQLKLRTGYSGGQSTVLTVGSLDLVCNNGLAVATDVDAVSKRHTKNSTIDFFAEWLDGAMPTFKTKVDQAKTWAGTPLSWDDAVETLEKMPNISDRKAAKFIEQLQIEFRERGANVYSLVSAFTYYSSHDSDRFPVRDTGNDNVATTLNKRAEEVNRWIASPVFAQLLEAA